MVINRKGVIKKMWIEIDDVIKFHGVKPKHLDLGKEDDAKLNKLVEDWIKQCEDLIKQYTNNKFTGGAPPAVKNVCLRLASNMIRLAVERRDSPIIKVNDWTVKSSTSSEIFTDDLKEDLAPFIIEKSTTSDPIDFFAITGD